MAAQGRVLAGIPSSRPITQIPGATRPTGAPWE